MTGKFTTHIDVEARPEEAFDYFVQPELLVRWMGDFARLEAVEGGLFSVDINGVLIRGHYVSIDRPRRIEIAWGEAGNEVMPPGATRLVVTFKTIGTRTRISLQHHGLPGNEAQKHAVGWPHFLRRLGIAAAGLEPGPDPWKISPPS